MVYSPLSHDSAGEISEPLDVSDWKETGEMPEPGRNMGNLVVVTRDYPDIYRQFTTVGPNVRDKGIGGKGIGWSALTEYNELKAMNGVDREEGISQGMPLIREATQACDAVLTLDPTSNGDAAYRSWKALEKSVGLSLAEPLTADFGNTKYTYKDLVVQPRVSLLHGCRHSARPL